MEDVAPFVVKTLQAFKSKEKTELSFKKGQTITVEKRNVDADTYFGFYGKHEGWFPNYYVVAVEGEPELRKSKGKAPPPKKEPAQKEPAAKKGPPPPKKEPAAGKESNGTLTKSEAKKKALNDKKEAKEQRREAKRKEKHDTKSAKRRGTKASNGDAPEAANAKPKEEGIPPIIEDTIAYLEREDRLKLEGLFRVSGSTNDVKTIQASFLKGKRVDLEKIHDPHTVAGVLKIFLREAKDPLLTFELYDCWVTAIATPGAVADKAKAVRQVVDLLPVTNRLILVRLMGLLNKVSKHSKVNLMTVNNIAIVFAPTLLRPPGDQLDIALQDSSYANHLVKFMIEEYDAVFLYNPKATQTTPTSKEDSEEFQKRMRRGSLALARGSIIGGQNTFQLANKTDDESPSEISVDYQDADNTDATETEDESESEKTTTTDDEGPAEETPAASIKPLSMQEMMEKILDGQVNEVDEYLATLPPDQTAKTKKELLERIDAMMQSEEFKE